MEKIITKTSAEAKTEHSISKNKSSCPECGKPGIGTSSTKTVRSGLFSSIKIKKYHYTCVNCNCEWELNPPPARAFGS